MIKKKQISEKQLKHIRSVGFKKGHRPWSKGLSAKDNDSLKNMAKSKIGKPSWNAGLTKETDKRVASIGIKNSINMIGNVYGHFCKGTKKPKITEKGRENVRISARRRVLRDGQWCSIGKNETQLLDEQEKIDNIPIYRQYYVWKLGYKVDGYNPFVNIVYEVYEDKHRYNIEKDLKRQKEIEECLKCKFIIIWDLKKEGSNI